MRSYIINSIKQRKDFKLWELGYISLIMGNAGCDKVWVGLSRKALAEFPRQGARS